ncbi:hypothetical protein MMC25_001658 [Agyrium rufum]|nr:hypothetical protein [Agyrium rufum]
MRFTLLLAATLLPLTSASAIPYRDFSDAAEAGAALSWDSQTLTEIERLRAGGMSEPELKALYPHPPAPTTSGMASSSPARLTSQEGNNFLHHLFYHQPLAVDDDSIVSTTTSKGSETNELGDDKPLES